MNKTGTIHRWDASRGFGFIRSRQSHADVFFHVRDFRGAGGALPAEGLEVDFEEIHVGGKGPRAMAVQPLASRGRPAAASPSAAARPGLKRREPRASTSPSRGAAPVGQRWMLLLMPLWLAAVAYGIWLQRLPGWTVAALVGINVLTFFAYAFDKDAAQGGRWRTQEKTLHLFSLAGGWPAAWLAQQSLRHKSSKASFQAAQAAAVLLHCAALAGWIFWLTPRSS